MHSEISIKDIDLVYFNLDTIKFFNSINENKLKENSIYFFVSIYFGVYRNVKYVLKDEYSRKKLKRLIVKNYNYIFRSNNFSLKEKISILNEEIYYSKIEKRKL